MSRACPAFPPGVSTTKGTSGNAASSSPKGAMPIAPAPIASCLSRLDPQPSSESLACTSFTRPAPVPVPVLPVTVLPVTGPSSASMAATPPSVSGVASGLLNASREVAGLLGITVIGAVLRTAQDASARGGADPVHAFLDGYHTGLLVTIGLMAAGVVVSYLTLRPRGRAVSEPVPTVAEAELATVDELAAGLMR